MAQERVERRLAAILAADVAGYSRLTGADEEGTLARLRAIRHELVEPTLARHGGRMVKTTGDGMLVEFASVVDAVRCAIEVQRSMAARNDDVAADRQIQFRVGINLGDVVVEADGDLMGDGVNVAARLEGVADPGSICVSRATYEQVKGKIDAQFVDLGEQHLKNIAEPVRAFRLGIGPAASTPATPALTLPDRPSIAVLPFQNMSGDPEQEYFADGIVEEITTILSRLRWLFVIARNSSFTYKGRAVDVKQAGRELGVRYVLEGSVRKAANRVRITAQLIDAVTGAHLWADRFDGTLEDIFDLQDEVTIKVVGAIAPKLEQAEIERARRKPTGNLDAYDYYLRAIASFYQGTKDAVGEAQRLFYRAIELDPTFAAAHGMAARCYTWRKSNGWRTDGLGEAAEMERLARRAVELGRDDAIALCTGGFALAHAGDLDEAAACIDRAIVLNPSLAWVWYHGGWVSAWRGEPEEAIERLTHAMRLSPLDPLMSRIRSGIAFAHFLAGRYDDACQCAEKALVEEPNFVVALRILAASYAMTARLEEARRTIARLRRVNPSERVSSLKEWATYRRPEDLARLEQGLRTAGLPE
ncbi:MAG TPA: adenylate/guanylate cyclase domain-containing protein [Candidatus Cybelea sp.]|nr:adenylate/guanylate cyclase domain-containing protein [Candidatus Cybelea sp.]